MSDEVKILLQKVDQKQDEQSARLNDLAISVAKQEVLVDQYSKRSDEMASELRKMNDHMGIYNAELKVHIAGVLELKEQNTLMKQEIAQRDILINQRLTKAEIPINFFEQSYKWLKWIAACGSVIGLLFGIFKWVMHLS